MNSVPPYLPGSGAAVPGALTAAQIASELALLDTALHGAVSQSTARGIRRSVEQYLQTGPSAAVAAGSVLTGPTIRKRAYKRYDSKAAAVRAVIEPIRDFYTRGQVWCPYCGVQVERYGGSRTRLDHHLPRAVNGGFPEFSIATPNLVPTCHPCNDDKKAACVAPGGGRTFGHPYFDAWMSDADVIATITQAAGAFAATFDLDLSAVAAADHAAATSHFQTLKLAVRYARYADEIEIDEYITTLAGVVRSGRATTAADLTAVANGMLFEQRRQSVGAKWQRALHTALAATPAVIDEALRRGTLP